MISTPLELSKGVFCRGRPPGRPDSLHIFIRAVVVAGPYFFYMLG